MVVCAPFDEINGEACVRFPVKLGLFLLAVCCGSVAQRMECGEGFGDKTLLVSSIDACRRCEGPMGRLKFEASFAEGIGMTVCQVGASGSGFWGADGRTWESGHHRAPFASDYAQAKCEDFMGDARQRADAQESCRRCLGQDAQLFFEASHADGMGITYCRSNRRLQGISCGAVRASKCEECPQTGGPPVAWCSDDCYFDQKKQLCSPWVEELDLYEVLEVADTADDTEIRKSYRKLSMKYHPDKQQERYGIHDQFAAIRDAYEVLSNPDRRVTYDVGGMKAVKLAEEGKLEVSGNKEHSLDLTMAELYSGAAKRITVSRRVICRRCRKTRDPKRCQDCSPCPPETRKVHVNMGAGHIREEIQQVPSLEDCRQDDFELDVVVDPGASAGDTVVFKHLADQTPMKIPGHTVVRFALDSSALRGHSWERHGDDLHLSLELSFFEALNGFNRTLRHIGGHSVELSRESVTQPGEVLELEGQGMPVKDTPSRFGKLIVNTSIRFPTHFSAAERKAGVKELADAAQQAPSSVRRASDEL